MQDVMMHLRCNEFHELASAGKKSLAISFFASEATRGRAREIRINKQQRAAQIRKIRVIRGKKILTKLELLYKFVD